MRALILASCLLLACSDGTGPGQDERLHDVIVFRSFRLGDPHQLYMIRPDGTGLEPLLFEAGVLHAVPAVSRDGRYVAWNSSSCPAWVQEYPDGEPEPAMITDGCPGNPRWSHDGRLAVTMTDMILVANALGGVADTVLHDGFDNAWLDWHPSLERLVYASKRDENWGIYELDLASGESALLVDTPGVEQHPRWAPDGDRLSYNIGGIPADSIIYGVWMYNRATASDTLLVADAECPCPWSPDGRYLLFNRGGIGPPGAFVRLELATGEQVPILERPTGILDLQPDWAW